MKDSVMSYINTAISKAELEAEIALEEIVNDLIKKVPQISIKNLKIMKCFDDQGFYYKVKILTSRK